VRAATPSAAAEIVVRRKDDFCGHIDRLGERLDAAIHGRVRRLESRLNILIARPGYAGFRGRVAMRARHVAELAGALRQSLTSSVGRRQRRHQLLVRALDQFDPRHRLAAVRMRLVSREGALAAAIARRLHAVDSRFQSTVARLEGLSPLAVLGRGYAVAWDATRTRILRDTSNVDVGDAIRVTLDHGELGCRVEEK
jgi:exodeoxyribonuclease VII large subunit